MATDETLKRLREAVEQCVSTPIESLIRRPSEWGSIDFAGAEVALEKVFGMLQPIRVLPIELLPESTANQISKHIMPVAEHIKLIVSFKLEDGGDPKSRRDNIIANLNSHVDTLYPVLTPHIPYLAYQRGDIERNIADLVSKVREADNIVSSAKQDVQGKQQEIAAIVKAAKEASASVGVAHFTVDFGEAADGLESAATKWLIAAAVASLLTLLAAFYFMAYKSPDAASTTAALVHLTVSKVVIIGVLAAVAIWCGRLYKATKHQASINRHRSNALKTFQAFIESTTDEAIRDAVLMETTRSIFALASSGYLDGGDGSPFDAGTKVVEMIKATKSSGQN